MCYDNKIVVSLPEIARKRKKSLGVGTTVSGARVLQMKPFALTGRYEFLTEGEVTVEWNEEKYGYFQTALVI